VSNLLTDHEFDSSSFYSYCRLNLVLQKYEKNEPECAPEMFQY